MVLELGIAIWLAVGLVAMVLCQLVFGCGWWWFDGLRRLLFLTCLVQ